MEKRIADLLAQIASKRKRKQEIFDQVAKEGRTHANEAETVEFKSIDAEIDSIKRHVDELKAERAAIEEEEKALIAARGAVPAGQAANSENRGVHISAMKDNEAEKPFRSFGEQMRAIVRACRDGQIDKRLEITQRAASGMSEAVESDGGYLIQKDFAQELIKRVYDTGVLPGRCRKLPISAGSNGIKINGVDETSRANGSRMGGIQAYWANEADEFTASKPKFRQMKLDLKKLIGLCYATDELLMDEAALGGILSQGFAEEFGFKLDDAILSGDGANKPQGILNSNALVTVNKESGQAAATFKYENAVKMRARLWGRSRANAAWFINQDVEPQLHTMSLAVGTGGSAVYLPAGGASDSPFDRLLGLPVIPIEQCSTLGTVGDVILADLSQYLLIEKGMMEAANSIHVRFLYDEQVFRFSMRVDGQPIWHAPLTPFKGSNTQSPFVTLQTRS